MILARRKLLPAKKESCTSTEAMNLSVELYDIASKGGGVLELEALAVDDARPLLVVLRPRDPHGLEGRERCQDGSADPRALRRRPIEELFPNSFRPRNAPKLVEHP